MRRRLSAVRKLVMATFEPSSRKERIWRFSPPRATCWPPSTKQQERDEVSVFTTKSHKNIDPILFHIANFKQQVHDLSFSP